MDVMSKAKMTEKSVQTADGKYVINSHLAMSDEQIAELLKFIRQEPEKARSVLGGRGSVVAGTVEGLGRVVSKHYTRGGILGRCITHNYLRLGGLRSEIEYRLLTRVREIGVSAPEPIAYISRGSLVYQTWLIARMIEDFHTLAELSVEDSERCERLVPKVAEQIDRLIASGVYHVDLHPGNVLITADDEVYLIDFDKAREFTGRPNALRDRYLCRWRRAAIKHNLPEFLSERVCVDLRKDYTVGL
jgi:3-deoxy-D-manno-octulosonic acid kinase